MPEAELRGWDQLDVIFVTGDAYIDHPAFGVPLLARLLEAQGLRVGIISQPDWRDMDTFKVLGRPRLFFAVSSGAMDSMVAHYTPARKIRRDDAYTPGNLHGSRPNRTTIVYTSCCKAAYKDVPVVIGGIEASLRRFAHYDYWDDKVRRSILFDSKADLLVYGMGEQPLLDLVQRLTSGESFHAIRDIRGTAVISGPLHDSADAVQLPSYEAVSADKKRYAESFRIISSQQNPHSAVPLIQANGDRSLCCNPPSLPLSTAQLDRIYSLPFTRLPHPSYREKIPAWEQIKSSVTTHRGCAGGCSFCAITHHQGKFIQSRSEGSILAEIAGIVANAWAHGVISDIGGPTANMYGISCISPDGGVNCRRESCLYPALCRHLRLAEEKGAKLLEKVRAAKGVRSSTVSSGIRFDMLAHQPGYFRELVRHHVGGLMKVAPEHLVEKVTRLMRKPDAKQFVRFLEDFRRESGAAGKRQAVIPYLISGHPGCTLSDMVELALKLKELGLRVEQVQDFTPTPGTLSTCMYYTGLNPYTGEQVYVPKGEREKRLQKSVLLSHLPEERKNVLEALRQAGRESDLPLLLGARTTPAPAKNGYTRRRSP